MPKYTIPTIISLLEDYAISQGLTTLTVRNLEDFAKLPGHPSRTTVWRKVGDLKEINRLVHFPLRTPTLLDLVALTPDSVPNLADFTPVASDSSTPNSSTSPPVPSTTLAPPETASPTPTAPNNPDITPAPEPPNPPTPAPIPAPHHNPRLRHYHHSVHTLIDRYLTTHRVHTITRAILARITALPGAPTSVTLLAHYGNLEGLNRAFHLPYHSRTWTPHSILDTFFLYSVHHPFRRITSKLIHTVNHNFHGPCFITVIRHFGNLEELNVQYRNYLLKLKK